MDLIEVQVTGMQDQSGRNWRRRPVSEIPRAATSRATSLRAKGEELRRNEVERANSLIARVLVSVFLRGFRAKIVVDK
jgi:hypothetical protein